MRKTAVIMGMILLYFASIGIMPADAQAAPYIYSYAQSTYIVQPGDTLFSIAKRYNISVNQLATANGLAWNSWLYIGQRLIIPGQATETNTGAVRADDNVYMVKRGDTLTSIALRLGIRLADLAAENHLYIHGWVYEGQVLRVPDGTQQRDPAPNARTGTAEGTYTVQRGDTLFSIARRHNTNVAALRAANNLVSNLIYSGQVLILPNGQSGTPPKVTPPPHHGLDGEKWIDVNLTTQTLTAYEGQRAVFTSLVSSGTSYYPTVVGTFQIYAKYRTTRMSGGSGASYYDLPNVPYTMYFYKGYALHGAYWHNNFGTPMSHGCVNLHPSNAEWLFNWAPIGTKVVTHY